MRQLAGSFSLEVVVDPVDSAPLLLPGELAALAGVVRVEPVENTDRTGMRFRLYLETEAASMVAPVARILADNGALLSDLHLGTPSLEDVFITLTGRGLR
jgi:ABC-2 type transport system ATP-binding protein